MSKSIVAVVLLATLMTLAPLLSAQSVPQEVDEWYRRFQNHSFERRLTRLHFYFHDVVGGDDPTAVEVARANSTAPPANFGLVRVFDNPLTVANNSASAVIGYGQGLYALTSKQEPSLLMPFTFAFTEGLYEGSTLSILGRHPLGAEYRELPVVGGTGVFRLATGTAVASTSYCNVERHDATFEFDVTVWHYGGLLGPGEEFAKDM